VFAQSPVRQDVSEHLGVFGLDKREAADDEVSNGNAAADNIVAAEWLGKGCGAHRVRALRQLHRATQVGKQGRERAVRCRDLAYQRCHIHVCRGRPEHSSLMREHCRRCSTLPPFYHGKRSHAIVTQCVRVRACKNPRRGKEETGWCLFVPTNMSPLLQNRPMHTKSKDQKRTRKILCA